MAGRGRQGRFSYRRMSRVVTQIDGSWDSGPTTAASSCPATAPQGDPIEQKATATGETGALTFGRYEVEYAGFPIAFRAQPAGAPVTGRAGRGMGRPCGRADRRVPSRQAAEA